MNVTELPPGPPVLSRICGEPPKPTLARCVYPEDPEEIPLTKCGTCVYPHWYTSEDEPPPATLTRCNSEHSTEMKLCCIRCNTPLSDEIDLDTLPNWTPKLIRQNADAYDMPPPKLVRSTN